MKNQKYIVFALVALICACGNNELKKLLSSLKFTTVDVYSLFSGSVGQVNGLASDSNGYIYAVGNTSTSGGAATYWTVRKSTDHGLTWTTKDSLQTAFPAGMSDAKSIAISSSNKIYVAGNDGNVPRHWIVRSSSDGGTTWSTIDDVALNSGIPKSISVAPNGTDIYVAGQYVVAAGEHWIVRKSSNSGAAWVTQDDYTLDAANATDANAVLATSSDVYVIGSGTDAGLAAHAIIRKSSNGGASWSNVFDNTNAALDQLTSISYNSYNGNLFVAGQYYVSGSTTHWSVRRSKDAGVTWSMIDNFQIVNNRTATPYSIYVTGSNIVATGTAQNTDFENRMVTRISIDGGDTWTTVDTYAPDKSFPHVLAFAATIDMYDNVFVGGYSDTSSTNNNWLIRRGLNQK